MNMKTITVTSKTFRKSFPDGIGIGEQNFSRRGGSYQTYQVFLATEAASYLEDEDRIRWWDRGTDCLPVIPCAGEIVKPDGRRVQLVGNRDCGIDTGHPPHLKLKTKTVKGLVWETDWQSATPVRKVFHAPWGAWYTCESLTPPGLWGITSHDEFVKWASDVREFDGKSIELPDRRRLFLQLEKPDARGWTCGLLVPQKQAIGDIPTNEPEIL